MKFRSPFRKTDMASIQKRIEDVVDDLDDLTAAKRAEHAGLTESITTLTHRVAVLANDRATVDMELDEAATLRTRILNTF